MAPCLEQGEVSFWPHASKQVLLDWEFPPGEIPLWTYWCLGGRREAPCVAEVALGLGPGWEGVGAAGVLGDAPNLWRLLTESYPMGGQCKVVACFRLVRFCPPSFWEGRGL